MLHDFIKLPHVKAREYLFVGQVYAAHSSVRSLVALVESGLAEELESSMTWMIG